MRPGLLAARQPPRPTPGRGRPRATTAATLLLALVATACSPPAWHRGPPSDHFTGTRFFNPDGEQGTGGAQSETFLQYLARAARGRHDWPAAVPVAPTRPARRVAGPAMVATWIGHATVLVQADGLNILTDPIWSERASPVSFAGPKRVRAPGVRFDDLPPIDLVLLSHDHYDHMDMATLRRLWARDRPTIVTGLGNEARLADAGIRAIGRDWGAHVAVRRGVDVRLDRVHHWSRRTTRDRDATLWTGFTVTLPHGDVYFAGDTGEGDGRWTDGATVRPPRLAILPIGAIHRVGPPTGNHIYPAQAVDAFLRLHAGAAIGVHWGTFELTDEAIDQPPRLLSQALRAKRIAPDRFRTPEPGVAWAIPAVPSSAN